MSFSRVTIPATVLFSTFFFNLFPSWIIVTGFFIKNARRGLRKSGTKNSKKRSGPREGKSHACGVKALSDTSGYVWWLNKKVRTTVYIFVFFKRMFIYVLYIVAISQNSRRFKPYATNSHSVFFNCRVKGLFYSNCLVQWKYKKKRYLFQWFEWKCDFHFWYKFNILKKLLMKSWKFSTNQTKHRTCKQSEQFATKTPPCKIQTTRRTQEFLIKLRKLQSTGHREHFPTLSRAFSATDFHTPPLRCPSPCHSCSRN